jgi:ribosomal protein L37AE/L43A
MRSKQKLVACPSCGSKDIYYSANGRWICNDCEMKKFLEEKKCSGQ